MRWNDVSAKSPGGACPTRHARPGSSLITSASDGKRSRRCTSAASCAGVAVGPEDRRVARRPQNGDRDDQPRPASTFHGGGRSAASSASGGHEVGDVGAPHRRFPDEERRTPAPTQSTRNRRPRSSSARSCRSSRRGARRARSAPTNVISASASATQHERDRGPTGSSTILRTRASRGVFSAPGVLVVRVRLVPHVGPGRTAAPPPRTRHSAIAAATAASRTPVRSGRCDSSTISPAITSAGTDSALIDTAPPAASPTHDRVRAGVGRRGSASANATASTDSASDGPSALTGPVTQRIEPLVVTSPAASSASAARGHAARARVDRDREQHAGGDRQQPRRVEGREADEVGEPDQREEQRALAREDVAERQLGRRASPRADDREHAVVEDERSCARRTRGCGAGSPRPRGSARRCASGACRALGTRGRRVDRRRPGRHRTGSRCSRCAGCRGSHGTVACRSDLRGSSHG